MRAYAPRPITHIGNERRGEWDVKRYAITYDGHFDAEDFADGRGAVLGELPTPARTQERPGLAFLIEHRGRDFDYIVLAWWDRENELPMRVWVRERQTGEPWRAGRGSESACVWDLQVIGAERAAYVRTMLRAGEPDREDYLASTM